MARYERCSHRRLAVPSSLATDVRILGDSMAPSLAV